MFFDMQVVRKIYIYNTFCVKDTTLVVEDTTCDIKVCNSEF